MQPPAYGRHTTKQPAAAAPPQGARGNGIDTGNAGDSAGLPSAVAAPEADRDRASAPAELPRPPLRRLVGRLWSQHRRGSHDESAVALADAAPSRRRIPSRRRARDDRVRNVTPGPGQQGQVRMQLPAFGTDSPPDGHSIRTREAVVTEAILSTVAYNDLFGYPPDAGEIWRYLHGVRAPLAEVAAQLQRLAGEDRLIAGEGCYALPGRAHYFAQRAARARVAEELWRRARRYAAVLASLPTVRMVSITGSLAVNNTEHDADIDFMLLVEGGTLWRTRAAAMVLQRIERRLTDTLCINYLRSDRALELPQKSLYVAHELLQTVPLYGEDAYREFLAANPWAFEFLPNAAGGRTTAQPVTGSRWLRACAGPAMRSRIAGRFENWECRRKLERFNHTDRLRGEYSEFRTEATGHRDDVRRRIEGLHHARLSATAAPQRRNVLFAQSYHLYFDPKLWREMHPYPPLGSLYGAAVARAAGHDVCFYDSMLATSPNSWVMALDRHGPGVVVLYEDNFNYLTKMCLARMREAALDMIAAAKRIDATVIVCGSDASDNAGVYLDAGADYVIRGEGEGPLGRAARIPRSGRR